MADQSDNVYIADLPAEVDENVIHQVFASYGSVMSCKAMPGKFPGQKGAALVRFGSPQEAAWVVENLNGNLAEGLAEPIKVRFANAKGSGKGGNGGADGGYGKMGGAGGGNHGATPWSSGGKGGAALAGTEQPSDNVYIADLPEQIDEQTIKGVFGAYGTVMSCRAMQSKRPGQMGAALVRFASADEAAWVVQNLNGNLAEGLEHPVKVRFSNAGGKGGGGGGGGGGFAQGGGGAVGMGAFGQAEGGKAGGKGKGKPGTFSSADIGQVISGLIKQLPGGTGKKPDENCLYITGLPTNTTDTDLYKLFAPFGAIPAMGVKAKVNPDGACSGVGFVDYIDAMHAMAAQQALNGLVLPDGTSLLVRSKRPKGQGPSPQQEV